MPVPIIGDDAFQGLFSMMTTSSLTNLNPPYFFLLAAKTNVAPVRFLWQFSGTPNQASKKSIPSSAFNAGRRQVPPSHPWFKVLPQSGNVSAMFGLVIALHEQLRETESVRKPPVTEQTHQYFNLLLLLAFFGSKGWFKISTARHESYS